jgi:Ulp1 family protease
MIIPVNIKLKHWILACIDFEEKWIAWLDSIGDTHEQETRLLFTWLTREHSLNRSSVLEPAEWSIHSGPPPNMQVPLQSNDFDWAYSYASTQLILTYACHSPSPNMIHGTYVRG